MRFRSVRLANISDLLIFIRAGLWSALIPIILDILAVPSAFRAITPRRSLRSKKRVTRSVQKALEYAEFWIRVRRRFLSTSCYQRTAILYRCLREQGIPVRVAIGLRQCQPCSRSKASFIGHSWLVLGKRPVLEKRKDLKTYTVTYMYP